MPDINEPTGAVKDEEGHEWPPVLLIRDTKLHDDMGGGGQRIYTTAGRGYKKIEYVRADLARRVSSAPSFADGVAPLCGDGFVYLNPWGSGEEYSRNHPIESGEVEAATDIRQSTVFEDGLSAQVLQLRAVLEPFVKAANRADDSTEPYEDNAAFGFGVMVGHLRAARSAFRAHNPQASSGGVTEAQAAYGLLWRMRADDKAIHAARGALLAQIGNEGQRAGLEWAFRTFGPHSEPTLEELP